MRSKTSVTGAKRPAVEPVDSEIEAGVHVRQHRCVHVDRQRQTVGAVTQQYDDIWAPAGDECNEDDEDRFHLANSLHRCHVTGFSSIL